MGLRAVVARENPKELGLGRVEGGRGVQDGAGWVRGALWGIAQQAAGRHGEQWPGPGQ